MNLAEKSVRDIEDPQQLWDRWGHVELGSLQQVVHILNHLLTMEGTRYCRSAQTLNCKVC